MKAGDMVMQSQFVAHWADGRHVVFMGDGDAISVCVAYLQAREIVGYGPSQITVLDFDERVVGAVNRFADRERLDSLQAVLYNCLDPLPDLDRAEAFYTNPPWGASNDGESVNVFVQRGMEAIGFGGEGLVVLAYDEELGWTKRVLANVQAFAASNGYWVSRMTPKLHSYHLDDNPDLLSCNLILQAVPGNERDVNSTAIEERGRLENFYGEGLVPRVRFVREKKRVDYGMASDEEYEFELFEE